MVWFSIFFSFVIGEGFDSWYASPGGAHGNLITGFIGQMVGNVGVIILLVVMLLFYMIYVTKNTIPWLQDKLTITLPKKNDADKADEEDDVDEEEEDVDEEALVRIRNMYLYSRYAYCLDCVKQSNTCMSVCTRIYNNAVKNLVRSLNRINKVAFVV